MSPRSQLPSSAAASECPSELKPHARLFSGAYAARLCGDDEGMTVNDLDIPSDLIEARGLVACKEPDRLVVAEVGHDGREHRLIPEASRAWSVMKKAAAQDGVEIYIQSAYRSVARQIEIIRNKLRRGERIYDILRVSAPPGFSEHHSGRAVDVVTPDCRSLESAFEATAAFRWLQEHAVDHGFTLSYPPGNSQGYQYEPWHWCYRAPVG